MDMNHQNCYKEHFTRQTTRIGGITNKNRQLEKSLRLDTSTQMRLRRQFREKWDFSSDGTKGILEFILFWRARDS